MKDKGSHKYTRTCATETPQRGLNRRSPNNESMSDGRQPLFDETNQQDAATQAS